MSGFQRGQADYLELGSWNTACSMCGRKRKAHEVVKNWQGMWRCPEHNEVRHPQDFVRGVPDDQSVPFAQPEADVFAQFCTPNGVTGIAAYAISGCAIADYVSPLFDPNADFFEGPD